MPKVAFGFTGCKLNRYEIQSISESLETGGFEVVSFKDVADCYVINTCTVTGNADLSSRNLIRRVKRLAPDSKVVVTGCYAQMKPSEIEETGADLVIPNSEKESIPELVFDLFSMPHPDYGFEREFGSNIVSNMGDLTRGFVKIQEGCDRECTYCTIWKSRGEVRSRKPEFIINEINELYKNDYKEIALTGVHIGKYNYDNANLNDLIVTLLENTKMPRIRLSSLYPTEIDNNLIKLIVGNKRICPHVHISIQSGDDDILKAMGRQYDSKLLYDIIARLKSNIPNITVGADIIVGFPGETETNFENSYKLVEDAGIDHLHVFPYSPRPGTPAAEMSDQIDNQTKSDRVSKLKKIGSKIKRIHLNSLINKKLEVLIENRETKKYRNLTGLSENYLRVELNGDSNHKGNIISVKPVNVEKGILIGEIITDNIS